MQEIEKVEGLQKQIRELLASEEFQESQLDEAKVQDFVFYSTSGS
jgi:hypothetical protein